MNGGPAFPTVEIGYENVQFPKDSMTLRDYFAAQAMVGLIGNIGDGEPVWDQSNLSIELAKLAYLAADAMLTERAK